VPRQSNILDPVSDTLPPLVWDNPADPEPILKEPHRQFIVQKIFEVLGDAGYDGMDKWLTLIVTGSLTTYQYSDRSDVDTSLFINSDVFPEWSRAEIIGTMVDGLDGSILPGTPYPLQGFVQSAQIKPEDIFKPGLRAGYLVGENRWMVPPDKSRAHDIEREMHDTYTYSLETADKMDRLIKYEPDKAVMFWHQLHRRRARDQKDGKGDFAPSNIAYKFIVNRGLTNDLEKIMGTHIAL
jgi:hypothetical protein